MSSARTVLRVGHRGAAGHAPENTLRAIACGIELGADVVEIDVQQTRDGGLVLMHDKRVDRTTDGRGVVAELSLREVRSLDAGKGERVPTLIEALQLARDRVRLLVELVDPAATSDVVRTVGECRCGDQIIYGSFHHQALLDARRLAPETATLALMEGVPVDHTRFCIEAKATYAGASIESFTREFLGSLHRAGVGVFVYTANDPRDIGWLEALGVDGIISDFPERVRAPQA